MLIHIPIMRYNKGAAGSSTPGPFTTGVIHITGRHRQRKPTSLNGTLAWHSFWAWVLCLWK